MTHEYFIKLIDDVQADIQRILSESKVFIQDMNNLLDERWDLFEKLGRSGMITGRSYCFTPDGMKEDFDLYEDCHMERHRVYSPLFILNVHADTISDGADPLICDMGAFKESYMQMFIWNSVFDW